MNPVVGWLLAAILVGVSWRAYGWPGVAMATGAIVFWLLLQFNRALRVMKNAAAAPLGQVPNAVMFQAALRPGMTMLQVVTMTRSLGTKLDPEGDDDWAWSDAGGSTVRLHFARGRLARWQLERAPEEPGAT